MKLPRTPDQPPGDDEGPGLPGFRSWNQVYLLVLGCFALWIGLLVALTRMYP
jgi:hypothetical protein